MLGTSAHLFNSFNESAITDLLGVWKREWPQSAILALVAEQTQEDIPALQQACVQADLPLLGAVFPELLEGSHFYREGIWLLRLDSLSCYRLIEGLKDAAPGSEAQIESMAEVAGDPAPGEKPTMLLIFDAMVPTIESWLEALYRRLGRKVRYMGVNAGSETFQPMPCLFDREKIIQHGVIAAILPNLPGGVLAHGYRPPEKALIATSARGNCISSIDWRPAFAVYSELARQAYGADITPDNFYQYGAHFPFGIVRATGEVLVRIPVALSPDGSLVCVGEIPENAILTLLHAGSATSPAPEVAPLLHATPHDLALIFYCAGRRMHDSNRATEELQELASNTNACLIGALSLGEIGSSSLDGYPLFHNATLVCLPWTSR